MVEKWGRKSKNVEASPSDLIFRDSRCIHYGAAAKGERPRVAKCEHHFYKFDTNLILMLARNDDVCYKLAKGINPELKKKESILRNILVL